MNGLALEMKESRSAKNELYSISPKNARPFFLPSLPNNLNRTVTNVPGCY